MPHTQPPYTRLDNSHAGNSGWWDACSSVAACDKVPDGEHARKSLGLAQVHGGHKPHVVQVELLHVRLLLRLQRVHALDVRCFSR